MDFLKVKPENIPEELKDLNQWVTWRWEKQEGKMTKVPYNAKSFNKKAKSNGPETWTDFDTAFSAYKGNAFDGIGIVLSQDDGLCGWDFDKCRNTKTGETDSEIKGYIKGLNSYAEVSPSGTGYRVILNATLPPNGRKKGQIEVYESGRYLTITGHVLEGMPKAVEERQDETLSLHKKIFTPKEKPSENKPILNDTELLQKAFNSANGDKVARLYNGDTSDYPSPSEADAALCSHLAFWLNREESRIDAAFRQSGLYREKWDNKHFSDGRTYGEATIQRSIVGNTEVYTEVKGSLVTSVGIDIIKPDFLFPPLTPENTRVRGILTERPPDPDYILNFKGRGFLTPGVVGSLAAAGGTGKTRLFAQLASMAATGESWGEFEATRPLSVLFLCAEETQDDLDRILWDTCEGNFPDGLFVYSLKGKAGPLMELKDGNPRLSDNWHWLNKSIENHGNLDLLIIDPKSRFYGLNELDNDQNTLWVACLEKLTVMHNIAIWFSHHVPKGTKEINQWMARGGSSLIDACRTNMGMIRMSAEEGKKFGISDFSNYTKIAINKINIGPQDDTGAWFKFNEKGTLQPVNPFATKIKEQATHLLFILVNEDQQYSRRELTRTRIGKHITDQMSEKFGKHFSRNLDLNLAIDHLLETEMLTEKITGEGQGRKKTVFVTT